MRSPGTLAATLSGVEFWSALGVLGWGADVWITQTPLSDIQSYEPIAHIPDPCWGMLALVIGTWQLAARLLDWRWGRVSAAILAGLLCKIVAVSNMVSDQPTPGSWIICALALANLATVIRLARR